MGEATQSQQEVAEMTRLNLLELQQAREKLEGIMQAKKPTLLWNRKIREQQEALTRQAEKLTASNAASTSKSLWKYWRWNVENPPQSALSWSRD